MSIPSLPDSLEQTSLNLVANHVHSVSLRLLRAVRSVDVETGLSGPRLSLLSVITFSGPLRIGQLAAIEQVSGPAITKLVDALIDDGLAVRTVEPDDRRASLITATAKGRRVLEQGRARRVEAIAERLAALSDRELDQVERTFRLLARRLL